eukprot:TRINITY_DN1631_c5_g1_i1.p1 TRINITY_DN1631_c5_g1~~TRINITY_DN1631_c5_g1_i1.p1  ORF type:complete len:252 (+),score=24.97 TRINITY_DN1631_c5_g1_i1:45-758(+)
MEERLLEARAVYGNEAVWFLQVAPPISAMIMILSPTTTLWHVNSVGSTGNLPVMPYALMMANSFVQSVFGVLLNDTSITVTNTFGLVCAILYCGVWFRNRDKGSMPVKSAIISVSVVFIVLFLLLTLPATDAQTVSLVGIFGASVIVFMFSGPLVTLSHVIRTKDASSITLPYALAGLVCCSLWALYGYLVVQEGAVWIPNALGIIPCLSQLLLLIRYPSRTASPKGGLPSISVLDV